jgi:hypothetical protein
MAINPDLTVRMQQIPRRRILAGPLAASIAPYELDQSATLIYQFIFESHNYSSWLKFGT